MPGVKIISTETRRLEKNVEYILIVRSKGLSFRKSGTEDPMETLLVLVLPKEDIRSIEIFDTRRSQTLKLYAEFFEHSGLKRHAIVEFQSLEIPATVLKQKIEFLIGAEKEITDDSGDEKHNPSQEEDDPLAAFLGKLGDVFGRPVRNGIDLGINLVKTGVSVLQQGLQSLGSLSDILKSKRIAEDRNRSAPRIIVPFDEKTFQAKKLGLHYIDTGQAPGDSSEASPVAVFLPGLGLTHSIFERYFEEFYALGYRIISLDHRGHGKSDRPEKIKDLRHETMFEDWQEFFSKLGLDKPPLELTVITFSVTGVLFLHFLENRTINSLKQLIILSGSDYIPSNISKAARIIPPPAVWIPLKRQAVERGKKALFSKPDDLLVDRVLETLITMDPDCIQQLVKIIGEKSFEKSVNDRKIGDVPLLFLVGDRDPIFGPTVAQKSLEDSSTTRSWKQVENGSHFFPFEKTEETFIAIHRFIESNRVNRE